MKTFTLTLFFIFFVTGCSGGTDDFVGRDLATAGVDCPEGTSNRNLFQNQDGSGGVPGLYVEDLAATQINSITFRNVTSFNGVYGTFNFDLSVKACDYGGTLLSLEHASLSPLNFSQSRDLTFNFNPPVIIPTDCASGKKTITFQVQAATAMNPGDLVVADTMPFSPSCPVQRTTNVTAPLGTSEAGQALAVTIDTD